MHRVSAVACAALLLSAVASISVQGAEAEDIVKGATNADVEWIFTPAGPQASVKYEIFSAIDKLKDRKGVTKALVAALNDDAKWQAAHVLLYIVTGTEREKNVNAFGPLRVDFEKGGAAKIAPDGKKAVKEYWAQELKK
jgi:hypothetical protein